MQASFISASLLGPSSSAIFLKTSWTTRSAGDSGFLAGSGVVAEVDASAESDGGVGHSGMVDVDSSVSDGEVGLSGTVDVDSSVSDVNKLVGCRFLCWGGVTTLESRLLFVGVKAYFCHINVHTCEDRMHGQGVGEVSSLH